MLASSLLVLLAAMWLAGLIQMTAILAFAVDGPMRGALAAAVRRAWLVVLPVAVVAAAWGLTDAAASWHARSAGQIDAAIIARTGWTRTGWLHETAAWVLASCAGWSAPRSPPRWRRRSRRRVCAACTRDGSGAASAGGDS
jgi:hypothetical protein